MTHPLIASVVGQVTDERWGQVLQTPHAYAVVEMYAPDGVARQRGIRVLTELTKVFDTPPVSLSELLGVADLFLHDEDIVSLLLLVPVGATLYIVSRGQGRVYLKRNEKLAVLLDGENALSGMVKPGDVVIAATSGFIHALTSEEIIGVFDHLSPVEVAEKLTMKLHEKEGGDGGAALIIQVQPEVEEEKKEPVIIEEMPPRLTPRHIVVYRAKAIGRRVTSVRQRQAIRRLITFVRKTPVLSSRRLAMYAVVLLFLISVVLGIRRQQLSVAHTAISGTITEAQHSFDEGMALLDLNPVKGRERLKSAQALLAPVVAKKMDTPDAQKAAQLYKEVSDNLTQAMHVYHVSPELFFDVSLLKSGATISDLSLFEDTIGVLDAKTATIFSLGVSAKSGKIVGGGPAVAGAAHIAVYGDFIYVWTPNGIDAVRLTDEKTITGVIPKSQDWGTIADMEAFGGNLYLLDTQTSRIWKYVATGSNAAAGQFSELYQYLNPDTLPNLSRASNMAIDGSVWLGTTTGTVLRFTGGKQDTYAPQGEDTPLGKDLQVYTNDADKMVYILDRDHHRAVVFDKDGLYMSQYVWDNAFPVTEVAASETAGKLFLLSGGKLYDVALR